MKNKKMKSLAHCAIAVLVGTITTYAQPPQGKEGEEGKKPPTVEEIFKQMDTNTDGKISKKEVKGPIEKDFDTIDLNKDGFISKEEMNKAPKPKGKNPEKKE